MLSAKGRDTDLAKGSALGADAYMTKPFSTRELADKVRELLARRMKVDKRELAAALAPGAVLALWALGGAALFAATLEPAERAALGAMLEPRAALLLLGWLLLSGVLGWLARSAYLRWVAASARLAEEARVLLAADVQREIEPQGSAETRALAEVINQLARQRDELRADVAAQVREASRSVEQERNRLAALMAELTQSVVVCNLDGRILLYNSRARTQFRALSTRAAVSRRRRADRPGPLDLRRVRPRADRPCAGERAAAPAARRGAPVGAVRHRHARRAAAARADGAGAATSMRSAGEVALNGFVLMLENITRDFADESERDRLLHGLTEGSRASLGNLQAAVEMLDYDDVDAATRERFHGVIRDEVRRDEPAHPAARQPHRADHEDTLAAGRHARRRPGGRGGAPHRGAVRLPRRAPARSTPRCGSRSTASRCCRRWSTWPAGWSTSTRSSWCSCAWPRPRAARGSTWSGSARR